MLLSLLAGALVGLSVGCMMIYYLMTGDFGGALLVLFIWPYVVYLRVKDDVASMLKGDDK